MAGPRLDLLKIEAHHCWVCGEVFSGKKKAKTSHHAIPQSMKPKRNIEIPVCNDCHKEINSYAHISLPKLESINNLITNLKSAIEKWERKIGGLNNDKS